MDIKKQKLKDLFEETLESDLKYQGDVTKIDYYNLFCKAASGEQLFKISGNNVCMLNCTYDEEDAVLIIFALPINKPEDSSTKNIAERIMEIIRDVESCFIVLDYVKSEEVKEDKYIYITVIKKIGGEDE